jgi:hypothetical protein
MGERLNRAIATLDDAIELVRSCGFAQSQLFLEMAKLQIKLDVNGITDEEFNAFCRALEGGTLAAASAQRAQTASKRPRRAGDLRSMRRAWQCPEGMLPRRRDRRG